MAKLGAECLVLGEEEPDTAPASTTGKDNNEEEEGPIASASKDNSEEEGSSDLDPRLIVLSGSGKGGRGSGSSRGYVKILCTARGKAMRNSKFLSHPISTDAEDAVEAVRQRRPPRAIARKRKAAWKRGRTPMQVRAPQC